ncbi:BLUF domain-containing protein [Mycobacterium sp.]|uniref:BLUF domain-containing protein n=1 Tax=Mycobacterium sp. TaxID=1785 RepID=UPI0025E58B25|nr:BLUF domain-containing protein [Mycobacterium sp.]
MEPVRPNGDPAGVFRLMYRSHSRISPENRKTALGNLFSVARRKNKELNITGALLIWGDSFVQTLEGQENAVRTLFATIERDERHEHVTVLEEGTVPERVFSRWAMARVSEDGEPDIPLIAKSDGIAPAAGRGTTSEQDSVLEVMRAAARGTAPAT